MRKFGLIGRNISYSFSKSYFLEKFANENINDASYENFDIQHISNVEATLKHTKNLKGLNVTIPYKETIIPYLNRLNKEAKQIGAVNTIKITKTGQLTGYNTDFYGFKKSLEPLLKSHHKKALILGTGGASKAVAYALDLLDISYEFVSRQANKQSKYTYNCLTDAIISSYQIIINCTPLGTYPNVNDCPDIPYNGISSQHILYDLIYNPTKTKFLKQGEYMGATISNGLRMLELQAEKAWQIWHT